MGSLYHEDIVNIDLENGNVFRSFMNKTISEGDNLANRFGVRLFRSGDPVMIGGATCMGYFIRHTNNDTVTINGGTFGNTNEAYITLPESCYAYDSSFTLVIKLIGGGITGTMRIIDGTVIDSVLGSLIDPGSVIPDLSDLMDVIERAETAAATINGLTVTSEQIEGTRYKIKVAKS